MGRGEGLLAAVQRAERANAMLIVGAAGPEIVRALIRVADQRQCCLLAAASPSGERLVGAMIYVSGGSLAPWSLGEPGDVLVVEGVALSQCGVRTVMSLLGTLTVGRVSGVILSGLSSASQTEHDLDVLDVNAILGVTVRGLQGSNEGRRPLACATAGG